MINRVEFNSIYAPQQNQDKHQGFQGITPQFFGPPGKMDQKMDQQLSSQLGIDTNGMSRTEVKANILSSLTGQSVEQMQNFFTNFSEQANKQDMQMLQNAGMELSSNPNYMQSMAENKASIANLLINKNMTENNASNQQGTQPQGQGGPPPEVLQMLQQLGLQPTGSLEGDMAAIQQKLQEMQSQNSEATQQGQNNGKAGGKSGPPEIPAAIQSVMNSVGVSPSGSKENDYSNVMSKIQSMITESNDDGQKQRAQMLLTVAQTAFSSQ